MGNRLSNSPSPYLRQHAENPVDWHPWGDEAFDLARDQGRPVFLSIGYSACHWCHVMAHESFEDPGIAAMLNASFVSVKVDREERPDVDQAYMTAAQLQNGHGGWPMTVFLTPDRQPFFAGTYFPPEDRGRHPGFRSLLEFIARKWVEDRASLESAAAEVVRYVSETIGQPAPAAADLDPKLLVAAMDDLRVRFDRRHGGFSGRPKFPPHTALHFLLSARESSALDAALRAEAAGMAEQTLAAIALGGVHDHVGGGFARYSTDEKWHLPHFEKMLPDNAQLLRAFARAGADALFARARIGIVRWLREEMTLPDGTFASSLDADSAGIEGAFYVWDATEIRKALGPSAGAFSSHFGVAESGNYDDEATGRPSGLNVLHAATSEPSFDRELGILRKVRGRRVRPGRDDKAVAAWNGMAIAALTEAGEIQMAARAAEVWEAACGERPPRHLALGRAWGEGFLEDYAHLSLAFSALFQATGERRWRDVADRLVGQMLEDFYEEGRGFAATSARHESLFARVRSWFDEAQPSGNAAAIKALLALGRHDEALQALQDGVGWMVRAPGATEALHECLLKISEWTAAGHAGPRSAPRRTVQVEWLGLEGLEGRLRMAIPAGYHVNANRPPANWLAPTALSSNPGGIEVEYPPAGELGYEGEIELAYRLPSAGEFELVLRFQPCTATECLATEERRTIVRAR